jgi:hypothetical protein
MIPKHTRAYQYACLIAQIARISIPVSAARMAFTLIKTKIVCHAKLIIVKYATLILAPPAQMDIILMTKNVKN